MPRTGPRLPPFPYLSRSRPRWAASSTMLAPSTLLCKHPGARASRRGPRTMASSGRRGRRRPGVSDPQHIDALLAEDRTFPPPPSFAAAAVVADAEIYERARSDPEAFWAEQAGRLEWSRP